MTRNDYRVICTALGFFSVITRGDIARDKQAMRAVSIARLIESFCQTEVPEAFAECQSDGGTAISETEHLLERYIAELRDHGSARFAFDRKTLLEMYELLLVHKTRFEQKDFYVFAQDDVIASRVLQLAEERIRWEET